jgi:hypothetical protein
MPLTPVRQYRPGAANRRRGRILFGHCLIFLLLLILASANPAWAEPVDLNLVLAVDVSDSIDAEELQLQRQGYTTAFERPEIIEAIMSGTYGRIAVAYFEWADSSEQTLFVDWMIIKDKASAQAFSNRLKPAPVQKGHFTSISAAISYGLGLLRQAPHESDRKVIDISGDGRNNDGPPLPPARAAALNWNVTINGLPIENERSQQSGHLEPGQIAQYYREEVIAGPNSFIVVAKSFRDIERAISRKLLREIAGPGTGQPTGRAAVR